MDFEELRKAALQQAHALMELQKRGLSVAQAAAMLRPQPQQPPQQPPQNLPAGIPPQNTEPATTTHHISKFLKDVGPKTKDIPPTLQATTPRITTDQPETIEERIDRTERAKVYPRLAVQAFAEGKQAAFALWELARAFDRRGTGLVKDEDLRNYCKHVGLGYEKYKRARRQAVSAKFITPVKRRGGLFLALSSLWNVAHRFQADTTGACPVFVPVRHLANLPKFKAAIFGAYLEGCSKKLGPISQKKLRELTGIPERTQFDMRKRVGIRAIPNFAKSRIRADDEKFVAGVKEHRHRPGAFTIDERGRKLLAWHLPNSYTTAYTKAKRGITRKLNSLLRSGLIICAGRATEPRKRFSRIFWEDREAAEKKKDKVTGGVPSAFEPAPTERYFRMSWLTQKSSGHMWCLV